MMSNQPLDSMCSPTPKPHSAVPGEFKAQRKKNGGHVRRQNRSCDQCRKGKRRCDAAVLRDDGTRHEDQDWEFAGMS